MNSQSDSSSAPAWLTPAIPPPGASPISISPGANDPGAAHPGPGPAHIGTLLGAAGKPESARRRKKPPSESRQPTPESIVIRPWIDGMVDSRGFPATGFYVERYWGPIVGPTCLMLFRNLARGLEDKPEGFGAVSAELALTVGCSAKAGPSSQFWRAIRRCQRFGLLRQSDTRVTVRNHVAPLTASMRQRLPIGLRHEHSRWLADRDAMPEEHELEPSSNSIEPGLALLRQAAAGLCTPEELRRRDRLHLIK